MKLRYVYRIDDIHPAMMWGRFWEVMNLLEKHQVVPLLGIIPDNQDQTLNFEDPNPMFDDVIIRLIREKKAEICQHGYQHVYKTQQRSINQRLYGRVSASEFAGIPYEEQYNMIKAGKERMASRGLYTDTWMAPSHTNDHNTYRALKELGFRYVTDGIGVYPYEQYGLRFVPQQIWLPRREFPFYFGVFTICLHLNDLSEAGMNRIKEHVKSNDEIISFSEAANLPLTRGRQWMNALYKIKRLTYFKAARPVKGIIKQLVMRQKIRE